MRAEEVGPLAAAVVAEVEKAVVGKRAALELVLAAMLAGGHVLVEDMPGLAKTLIARSLAAALGLEFKRIQFTPDLMPSDITGSSVYLPASGEFEFRPGPVFTNLLLADEVNRAPAKTQAALLEAMGEGQVTVDGRSRPLAEPFLVVATQNPVEFEGTYPLPEAQLDRFLVRVGVGYPERLEEWDVLERRARRRREAVALERRVTLEQLLAMQAAIETVHVAEEVGLYIVDVVAATRAHPRLLAGSSPRGSLALLRLSRARAAMAGRDFVTPDDVKALAPAALAHRLSLRPELWVQRVRGEDIVAEVLGQVPAPKAEPRA